jgi:hypothetical protein
MRNRRVARDLVLLQGARRENILYGSSTDEQHSSSAKDRQPGGLNSAPISHFDIGSYCNDYSAAAKSVFPRNAFDWA